MLTLGPRTLETWMFYHTGLLLSYCSHRRPLGVKEGKTLVGVPVWTVEFAPAIPGRAAFSRARAVGGGGGRMRHPRAAPGGVPVYRI